MHHSLVSHDETFIPIFFDGNNNFWHQNPFTLILFCTLTFYAFYQTYFLLIADDVSETQKSMDASAL